MCGIPMLLLDLLDERDRFLFGCTGLPIADEARFLDDDLFAALLSLRSYIGYQHPLIAELQAPLFLSRSPVCRARANMFFL